MRAAACEEAELAEVKTWHVPCRADVDSVTAISDTRRDTSDITRFVSFTVKGK